MGGESHRWWGALCFRQFGKNGSGYAKQKNRKQFKTFLEKGKLGFF